MHFPQETFLVVHCSYFSTILKLSIISSVFFDNSNGFYCSFVPRHNTQVVGWDMKTVENRNSSCEIEFTCVVGKVKGTFISVFVRFDVEILFTMFFKSFNVLSLLT